MVISHLSPDADGIAATATLEVNLWETNDYPPLLIPQSGTVCSDQDRDKLGLLLSAMDEDMSPQADPFTFNIADQNVAANWTIITLNGKNIKTINKLYVCKQLSGFQLWSWCTPTV